VAGKLLALLSTLIERAQARGEILPGAPLLNAFSIVGRVMAAGQFSTVFGQTGAAAPELAILARQHAGTVLRGLLTAPSPIEEPPPNAD
jgi:hypothetical protein